MSATLSHNGLPVGIKRTQFIERIAPALKARGLKTSAIVYLSKAFDNWTRDQDYEPGRICWLLAPSQRPCRKANLHSPDGSFD